ncbi:hypothetical protein GFK26_18335 [Variovorax paradoxus]|uniref:Uncharacterized protein n=1 Tax=Variovorax paradoxus TaxID=34073 RepID=A0A5Q0M702_VARPD|nr:hypothetical protein [Variovorax paradoxus]QFZ84587.1 hypothetical protein GFK26_18335 [Variovorax paradoxus]
MEVSFKRKCDLDNVLGNYKRIDPDKWNEMSFVDQSAHITQLEMRLEHARRTHGYYQDCRKELGYDIHNDGMSFEVWSKTTGEAMDDHVRQMQKAVHEHRAYLASLPEGWGAW